MVGVLLVGAADSRAQPASEPWTGANGPVTLAPGERRAAGSAAVADDARDGVAGAPSASAAGSSDPPGEERQDTEGRGLGTPNGWLSARPAEGAAEERRDGPLARLDPRRNELVRVLGALGIVLALLVLVRTVMKRAGGVLTGGGRPSGVLEILARYPIARGQALVVLRMARRILLVHQTGASMTTLSEVTDPDEVSSLLARMEAGSRQQDAPKFRATLNHFQDEHERLTKREVSGMRAMVRHGVEVVDLTRSQAGGMSSGRTRRRARR